MKSSDAYEIVKQEIIDNTSVELFDSTYNPDAFGNFIVSFVASGVEQSITADRGQVYFCQGINGEGECEVIAASLSEVNSDEFLQALRANMRK